MNRWRLRLAELCNPHQEYVAAQAVQNVQNSNFEQSGHFEQRGERPSAHRRMDANEEGAAIIEHDSRAPRAWAEALARLDLSRPPCDMSPKRWLQFIDDCGRFLDGGWAARADELGWGPLELFGCDRVNPFARLDRAGLLWLLNGGKLVALTAATATIETTGRARQTYRRSSIEVSAVALAWELAL